MNRYESERRLAELYDTCAARVHAYLVRHVGPDGADDLLSEVFLVAMRRIDDVPDDALPWLVVTARHLAANDRRSGRRRERTRALLQAQPTPRGPSVEDTSVERMDLASAFATLTDKEQEALLLVTWDGLDLAQAAVAAGCRERAFRGRLGRARQRLAAALGESPPGSRAPRILVRTDDGVPS
ncbi:MAG: sigma-70 family RNA polymerase sigma factor [Aeromicrobium erythreum]